MSRLVVVSNRIALPKAHKPGGLAAAVLGALREAGGIWFGWSGELAAQTATQMQTQESGRIRFVTVDLSARDHEDYYAGFANRTLWPLFHFRPSLVDYTGQTWASYRAVNAAFAERLVELLEPEDRVWIHDYHLIPLAAELRARGCRQRMGFFLHTPFPPAELLRMLPVHRELFGALAAYDLVGFHTQRYARAWIEWASIEAGAEVDGDVVRLDGHAARVGVFPISIETAEVARMAANAADDAACRQLRESLQGRRLVIGVDRLDYSKGLPERFSAFGRFLEAHPEHHRKVTLLQIAPTSRGEVPEYRQVRRELERIAGAINGRYAEPDWVPVRYVNKAYQQAALAGFYRMARVGFVSPLRDGMNLVAKEYVASQDESDPGVLLLSQFAGAAEELGEGALCINPFDLDGVGARLHEALVMPLEDRRRRWRSMMDVIERHDITAWRNDYLAALDAAGKPAARGRALGQAAIDTPRTKRS